MRLLASLSFRLSLLYALVFGSSLAILLALYYLHQVLLPLRDVRSEALAEAQALVARYDAADLSGLAARLEARVTEPAERNAYHVLLSPSGDRLSGNLQSWPERTGVPWLQIEDDSYVNGERSDHTALVYDQTLPGGGRLLIGRDVEDLLARRTTIGNAATWLILAGLPLGVLGGTLMSRVIGRRMDAIGATAMRVMAGGLHERVPLEGSDDDFDRLAGTLNLMLDRIELLLQSVRRVSDSVAHELRTPLTRLHADLSDLRDGLPEAGRPMAASAMAEAERLIALFDAVLRIARIDSRGAETPRRRLNLSVLLEDAAEAFGPAAEEAGLALEGRIAPDLWIAGNDNLIFQAVGNLLDNAIKYTPRGGRVQLSATRLDGRIALLVQDDGGGIPAEDRERVLERFMRLPAAAAVPGVGLGLSFVKAVADAHGSDLELRDAGPGLVIRWNFDGVA